jgi:cation diffusion facilitator CzcD-associated flavoprotein CzcO
MTTRHVDVVVIGAGPYGLAAAAHLRRAGVSVRILGTPMSFWKRHMPKGMRLRSRWDASHIGDPRSGLTLDVFQESRGAAISRPVPLDDFIAYAHWFQERAVPEIDPRQVRRVEALASGFRIIAEDNEPIDCNRVVVAGGIAAFARRPSEFDELPPDLASHSSEQADLGVFSGRRVAVIGGGQSAIESAVLLGEAGADVEVIMRAPTLRWVGRATRSGPVGKLFFDRTDVGPAFVSHLIAHPTVLRRMPARVQESVMRRSLAPGASLWLRPRMGDVRVTTDRQVVAATRSNGHLRLQLDDATTREIDHALLATGYRVDVRRYGFLGVGLLGALRCVEGHPVLDAGLQSSVPGLHFLGAPAALTFGPLLRFVSGTEFACRALVRSVTGATAASPERGIDDPAFERTWSERRPS